MSKEYQKIGNVIVIGPTAMKYRGSANLEADCPEWSYRDAFFKNFWERTHLV
jgi:hypothetical protein